MLVITAVFMDSQVLWDVSSRRLVKTSSYDVSEEFVSIFMIKKWKDCWRIKTNLMPLAFFFHFSCAQHVSDINVSIIRGLRLFFWITALVVLFLVRCVFGDSVWLGWSGIRVAGWSTSCASACNAFNPRKCSWYSFLLEAASTPGS